MNDWFCGERRRESIGRKEGGREGGDIGIGMRRSAVQCAAILAGLCRAINMHWWEERNDDGGCGWMDGWMDG